jgi:hypothetical protein
MPELCFGLDPDAPPSFRERWRAFKEVCEGGEHSNRPVTHAWIASCGTFPSPQEALLIDYATEGGLRTQHNNAHLRYRDAILDWRCRGDDLILIRADGVWGYEDLKRISLGFQCMASKTLKSGSPCVSFWMRREEVDPIDEELAFIGAHAAIL